MPAIKQITWRISAFSIYYKSELNQSQRVILVKSGVILDSFIKSLTHSICHSLTEAPLQFWKVSGF